MILNPKTNRYLKKTSQAGKRLMKQLIADGVTPQEQKEQHPEDVCHTRPEDVCYTRPQGEPQKKSTREPQKNLLPKANGVEKKSLHKTNGGLLHKTSEIKYNMSEEEFDSLYELPSDLTQQFKSYSTPKIMTAGAEIVSQDLRRFKNLTDREMDNLFKKMLIKKLAENEKNTCVEKPSKSQKNSTHKPQKISAARKIKIIQPPSDSESESDSS